MLWFLLLSQCVIAVVVCAIFGQGPARIVARALAGFVIVVAVLITLGGFMITQVGSSHALARRSSCQYKCGQIQSAIHQFAEANRRLPYLVTTLPETPSGPTEYVTAGWVPPILAFLDRNHDLYAIYESNAHSTTLGTPYNFDRTQEGPPGYMFIRDAYLTCPESNEGFSETSATVAGGPAAQPTSYAANAGYPDQTADTSQPLDYQENGVFFDQAQSFAGGYPPAPKTDLAYISKYDGTTTTILLAENIAASFWAEYNGHPDAPVSFAPRERTGKNFSYESPDGLVWFDHSDGTMPEIGLNQGYNGSRGTWAEGANMTYDPASKLAADPLRPAIELPLGRRIPYHLLRRPHHVHEPGRGVSSLCPVDDAARIARPACRQWPVCCRQQSQPGLANLARGADSGHRRSANNARSRESGGRIERQRVARRSTRVYFFPSRRCC